MSNLIALILSLNVNAAECEKHILCEAYEGDRCVEIQIVTKGECSVTIIRPEEIK